MRRWPLVGLITLACSTNSPKQSPGVYHVMPLSSGISASFRGVDVVDGNTAWVSGTGGTVLLTTDGGATWTRRRIPDTDSLDFRDIEAFSARNAFVLSAGEDGRIYRTVDGGASWALQFKNTTKGAFFDCFDFWNVQHGIAMSDPIGGKPLLLRTTDGRTWTQIPTTALPTVLDNEAAFAASGTCVITKGSNHVYLATGGGATARVFASDDRGETWRAVATPVPTGSGSAGIFSLAFRDELNGVALGGDYQKPAQEMVVGMTVNGGKTWSVAGKTSYVSGAAFVPGTSTIVAVGTKGTRVSDNRGVTWMTIDTLEYNAVSFAADGTGYAVGPRGRIAKLVRR